MVSNYIARAAKFLVPVAGLAVAACPEITTSYNGPLERGLANNPTPIISKYTPFASRETTSDGMPASILFVDNKVCVFQPGNQWDEVSPGSALDSMVIAAIKNEKDLKVIKNRLSDSVYGLSVQHEDYPVGGTGNVPTFYFEKVEGEDKERKDDNSGDGCKFKAKLKFLSAPNGGVNDGPGNNQGGGVGGGAGGFGGGGTCLLNNSLIVVSKTITKKVQDLKIGEKIMAFDIENHKNIKTKITKIIKNHPREFYYCINGNLFITNDHPVLITSNGSHSWKRVENLQIGDRINSMNGLTAVKLIIKVLKPAVTVYIETELGNYIVKGKNDYYVVNADYKDKKIEEVDAPKIKALVSA